MDVTGQKFARLTAIKFLNRDSRGNQIWLFNCDCGNTTKARLDQVKFGRVKSCGCFKKERWAIKSWGFLGLKDLSKMDLEETIKSFHRRGKGKIKALKIKKIKKEIKPLGGKDRRPKTSVVFMDDGRPLKIVVGDSHKIKCSDCDEIVERKLYRARVTCLGCKNRKLKELLKKQKDRRSDLLLQKTTEAVN